ncbi:MAG: hypothetical protein P1V36_01890 [Planctomycetota bacterium]|nr:hypothetical protein [Planctomycetota bacterium]
MGWYSSTARAPAPKIWKPRASRRSKRPAPPRLQKLRLRSTRRRTRTTTPVMTFVVCAVAVVFLAYLGFMILEMGIGDFDLTELGKRGARLVRGAGD